MVPEIPLKSIERITATQRNRRMAIPGTKIKSTRFPEISYATLLTWCTEIIQSTANKIRIRELRTSVI